ncbi:MAG: DNA repair protein RecO [Alphaproteobacteria bacterium]|nr:DNA repair protein RecO [Alphaproteobacteria bacterium]
MEQWNDQAIILNTRAHGESGAVVSLLSENHGRHAGYVHGGQSSKKRAFLQPGGQVSATWNARTSESLGNFALEQERGLAPEILENSLRLAALLSACALCDAALPEREAHPGLYHGTLALIDVLMAEHWEAAYVMWEIALLRELGFHLELDKCAGGGDPKTLTHVSPKSGRAVSLEKAEPYQDKLLILPDFLRPQEMRGSDTDLQNDILNGLKMTAHFLEHWAFIHHTHGIPEARVRLQEKFEAKY